MPIFKKIPISRGYALIRDKSAMLHGLPFAEGLFDGIENEARVRRPAGAPANDPPGICIDDRGHVGPDETGVAMRQVDDEEAGLLLNAPDDRHRLAKISLRVTRRVGSLVLRHDHGSNFIAGDFQDEIKFLGIENSPAFVRQPEGNGVTERVISKKPLTTRPNPDFIEQSFSEISRIPGTLVTLARRRPAMSTTPAPRLIRYLCEGTRPR
jgi:hypothetical protein